MRPTESFIQQPIRSLQTMLQVIALDDERIPLVIPDGIYGQTTVSAVNRFQQLYNLPNTGVADQKTWEKIVEIYEPAAIRVDKATPIEIILNRGAALKQGSEHPYVYFIQIMLAELADSFPSIIKPDITGKYDTATTESVISFQKIASLPVTGLVDKVTWKYLVHMFTLYVHHNYNEEP